MSPQNTSTVSNGQPDDAQNDSVPDGCITTRFSEWEYLPWNNSDNIVSKDVLAYSAQVRSNALQILFLIGGPANVINMAVFFKLGLKDRVNLLLFSLSVADEVTLIAGMLTYAREFYFQFTGVKNMSLYIFMKNNYILGFISFCYFSFVLSALIACERCYCVLRPLQYQALMRTKTLALIIVALCMIVPGLYFIVASRYFLGCVYDPDTGVKTIMNLHREFYHRYKDFIDYLDIIVFGMGLPNGVVIVVVTATAITSYKLRQTVAWRTKTTSSVSAREVALTKMLIGTSVLFIICVFPSILRRLASLFIPEMNTARRSENFYLSCIYISQIFVYINASFNIFIYYIMGSRYRETFWTLFKRKADEVKRNQSKTVSGAVA